VKAGKREKKNQLREKRKTASPLKKLGGLDQQGNSTPPTDPKVSKGKKGSCKTERERGSWPLQASQKENRVGKPTSKGRYLHAVLFMSGGRKRVVARGGKWSLMHKQCFWGSFWGSTR